jgi:hypothetical protein
LRSQHKAIECKIYDYVAQREEHRARVFLELGNMVREGLIYAEDSAAIDEGGNEYQVRTYSLNRSGIAALRSLVILLS